MYIQWCEYLARTSGWLIRSVCAFVNIDLCIYIYIYDMYICTVVRLRDTYNGRLTNCVCVCVLIYIYIQWCDYVTRTTGRLTKSVRLMDTRGFTLSCISSEGLKRDGDAMVLHLCVSE